MSSSIFSQIIKGEIPAYKIYEDEHSLAFLDIHPVQPGHTLVIPKTEVEFIWDLDDETYTALMGSVKKVGKRLRQVMNKPYVGVQVAGVDVPHAHVHLIPFQTTAEFMLLPDLDGDVNHEALKAIAEKLKF